MAQTTGAIGSKDFIIETSPDGTIWTDRSGQIVRISPAPITRRVGQTNTFGSTDTAIVTAGQRPAVTYHLDMLYTEVSSELWEIARISIEAGADFYIRYAPKGGQTGEFRFTSAVGKLSSLDYPVADANSGDPVYAGVDFITPGFTKAVVP
jgi:hypothetical protein